MAWYNYIYFTFVQEPTSLRQPGEITGRTVLNVFGPMGHGGRWILDSLKVNFTSSKVLLTPKITILLSSGGCGQLIKNLA